MLIGRADGVSLLDHAHLVSLRLRRGPCVHHHGLLLGCLGAPGRAHLHTLLSQFLATISCEGGAHRLRHVVICGAVVRVLGHV